MSFTLADAMGTTPYQESCTSKTVCQLDAIPTVGVPAQVTSPSHHHFISLPGTGGVTNPTTSPACGEWIRSARCRDHPHDHPSIPILATCHRYTCPTCWKGTVRRAAGRISSRLQGYLDAQTAEISHLTDNGGYMVPPDLAVDGVPLPSPPESRPAFKTPRRVFLSSHWVISPPISLHDPELAHEDPAAWLDSMRSLARKYCKRAGITGGTLIVHAFRLNSEDDDTPIEAQREKYKEWKNIRSFPSWWKHVRFSPHFHIVGWGYIRSTAQFYEDTGAVVRKIRRLADVDAIRRLAFHLLSHAALIPGKELYSFFGLTSGKYLARIKESREKISTPVKCRRCGADMLLWVPDDSNIFEISEINTEKVYFVYDVRYKYRIKGVKPPP